MKLVDRFLYGSHMQDIERSLRVIRRNLRRETPNQNETTIFFGTTVANFLTCTAEDEKGNLGFVKNREPRHYFPDLQQFTRTPISAAEWAVMRALEQSSSSPLILEGSIANELTTPNEELLPGVPFPVRRVWVSKPRKDWTSYNSITAAVQHVETPWTDEVPELTRLFTPANPRHILGKYRLPQSL